MIVQRKDQMTGATGPSGRIVSNGTTGLNVGTTGIIATTAVTEITATTVATEITAVIGAITGETRKKTGIKRENSDRTTDRREATFHPETVLIGHSGLTIRSLTRALGLKTAVELRRTGAAASSRRFSTRSWLNRCRSRHRTLPQTP